MQRRTFLSLLAATIGLKIRRDPPFRTFRIVSIDASQIRAVCLIPAATLSVFISPHLSEPWDSSGS